MNTVQGFCRVSAAARFSRHLPYQYALLSLYLDSIVSLFLCHTLLGFLNTPNDLSLQKRQTAGEPCLVQGLPHLEHTNPVWRM